MPWNQPTNKAPKKKEKKKLPFILIGAILLAVIPLIYKAFVCVAPEVDTPRKSAKRISDQKKQKQGKDTASVSNIIKHVTSDAKTNIANRVETNKAVNSNSPWANKPPRIIKMRKSDIKPRRFVYDAEEAIASLLEIEPGTSMYGDIPYTHFNKKFQQALMQKVKINDDDDEYTKELKKQVQAVKDDFKKVLLEGGNVGEEMRKARNELKELGRYRDSLMRELHTLRKSGNYTSQDMKDFESAANKMLEEKGLKPIKVPAVLLRNMELKERKNQK